jgi:hypothetical protein
VAVNSINARADEEIWLNPNLGNVWYMTTDTRGRDKPIAARPGQRFRITQSDRELNNANVFDSAADPFLNGVLVRVDARAEAEQDPEYQSEQALTNEALFAMLAKSGMAFQSSVKKLDERNVLRLRALIDVSDSSASVAQVNFVKDYITKTYNVTVRTSTNEEIKEEKGFSS